MYYLFSFFDCENDWNSGGMDNFKGSFRTLKEVEDAFDTSSEYLGQIAIIVEGGLVLLQTYRNHPKSTHPDDNRWIVNKEF